MRTHLTGRIGHVSIGFFGTLLIPTAVYMLGRASSMTSGLLVAEVVWLSLAISAHGGRLVTGWDLNDLRKFLCAISLLLMLSFLSGALFGPVDRVRLIGSTVVLLISCVAAAVAAFEIARAPEVEIKRIMANCLNLMFLFASLAFLGVPALGGSGFEKPVILFTEKSHYALALAPILIFAVVTSRKGLRWLILSGSLCVALGLQNTTALAAVLIAVCMIVSARNLVIIILLALSLGLLLNTEYYASRLDLSGESRNLSTLVFLSGWERAYLNVRETWGLGVGFQQFGVTGSLGDLMELIEAIAQGGLNLNDGGTTASKLVGELGVIGIVALVAYVHLFVRTMLRLRRFAQLRVRARGDVHRIFWDAYVAAAALDLFVRGQGYFSVGIFMLLVALFGKQQSRKLHRRQLQAAHRGSPLFIQKLEHRVVSPSS